MLRFTNVKSLVGVENESNHMFMITLGSNYYGIQESILIQIQQHDIFNVIAFPLEHWNGGVLDELALIFFI